MRICRADFAPLLDFAMRLRLIFTLNSSAGHFTADAVSSLMLPR